MKNRHRRSTITLILGGARSGKSSYGLRLAEGSWSRPVYLATAEVLDDEMAERVRQHRRRRGPRWQSVEEPLEVPRVLADPRVKADGILVDCVTLWLSNVLLKEGEAAWKRRSDQLRRALRDRRRSVILISNEVGMGIVPENALARRFRDLAGWFNQLLAAEADTVVLVVAGLPVALKGSLPRLTKRRAGIPTTRS
jgi:adenosylcobinamide kinase/adenosylcobinamide-phosphate guanylyltransferase